MLLSAGTANGTSAALVKCDTVTSIWTVPGDFTLLQGELQIYNETIQIAGFAKFGPQATIVTHFITANNITSGSGIFVIGVAVDWGGVAVQMFIDFPTSIGYTQYIFATYPFAQATGVPKPMSVTIPSHQRACRRIPDGVTVNFPGNTALAFGIQLVGSDPCDSLKNRQWVIAGIVLCAVWAGILGCFALVTCHNAGLKDKYWESDYVRT